MKLILGWTRVQIVFYLGTFLLLVLSILQFNVAPSLAIPSQAQSQLTTESPFIEITQGWEYRWGDFPVDETKGWQAFRFPKKLSKPNRENIIWFRVSLPEGHWKSTALYLRSVPHILEAYLDDQLIYKQYSLDSQGKALFEGYQLPIVSLPKGYQGKKLLFRVYVGGTSSIYVGLFDRVVIGVQPALIKRLLQQETDVILAVFFTLLGLTALLLSFKRQEKRAYLSFGSLSIFIGLYTISRSDLITLFFDNSLVLDYVHYTSFYLIPVSACIFFEEIFVEKYRAIIRYLWQIDLIYTIAALLLVTSQVISWVPTIYPAQLLFLSSALILLAIAINRFFTGSCEAKQFTLGFIILTLSGVHDVLVYMLEPLHWYQKLYPWGTFVFILISAFILENRFGEARKRLQDYAIELEKKNHALEEMNQLKDEFLANTSHELKTPLNGIIGIAESLIDGAAGKLSQRTLFNLSLIVSSGRRLTQLVNDLLDFSQLKHKNLELKIQPVGMREITDVVLTLSQPLISKKSVQLVNQISLDIPPVDADENRVQQILYNLVGNAIKFTESGTVKVFAAVANNMLEITVEDTGIGIPADKLDRIFESFEQANGSMAREYGGAGLGLAVTKQLVQLHGGNIHVESTVGRGSRFLFTLPLSRGKVESQLEEKLSKIQNFSATAIASHELFTNKEVLAPSEDAFKILIVDDEPVNLQVLINYLSLQNYAITQASSGIEALNVIRQGFKPDLILLDIMMPRMTGYELCQKIREQFPAYELPVVLLTAKNQVSDLVEGFSAGANDYLTKPILKNELLARIKTHIRLSKINIAYGRFVPHEFLQFLERESIVDVKLGDQVQKEMTVLFADIRSFTSLSEKMTPKENFDFLNAYLSRVSPVIRKYNGFIDKYIGDAVMALFPQTTDDALQAAIEMQNQVSHYNFYRQENGEDPIAIGIGLHTGSLMLGTVGEPQRMEGTVIADAVNLASRLEGLTKVYGVDILISEQTLRLLANPENYNYRFLGQVKVKGKSQAVAVFEVYERDSRHLIELKRQTRVEFEQAVTLYVEGKFAQAQQIFQQVLQRNQQDRVTQLYIERCKKARKFGVSELNIVIS